MPNLILSALANDFTGQILAHNWKL